MSSDDSNHSPESDVTDMNFSDTELTLGLPLPGGREVRPSSSSSSSIGVKSCWTKRGYSETVDLNLGTSIRNPHGNTQIAKKSETDTSSTGKSPPATKSQEVVGWPPVRPGRKKALMMKRCTYVKVAVDGAPYLRKVDLDIYGSYQELLRALEELFSCFTISSNYMDGSKSIDTAKGTEYVPTYEDKDGDWMLVGDVPWKMFIESCNRIRLMKSTEPEAICYLAPKTTPNCTSSS